MATAATFPKPLRRYSRDELATIVGGHHNVDGTPGNKAEMIRHLDAMLNNGPRPRIAEVDPASLETPAAYFARTAAERRS